MPLGSFLAHPDTEENKFASATGGTVGEPQDNVDAAAGGGILVTAATSTTNITGHSTVLNLTGMVTVLAGRAVVLCTALVLFIMLFTCYVVSFLGLFRLQSAPV